MLDRAGCIESSGNELSDRSPFVVGLTDTSLERHELRIRNGRGLRWPRHSTDGCDRARAALISPPADLRDRIVSALECGSRVRSSSGGLGFLSAAYRRSRMAGAAIGCSGRGGRAAASSIGRGRCPTAAVSTAADAIAVRLGTRSAGSDPCAEYRGRRHGCGKLSARTGGTSAAGGIRRRRPSRRRRLRLRLRRRFSVRLLGLARVQLPYRKTTTTRSGPGRRSSTSPSRSPIGWPPRPTSVSSTRTTAYCLGRSALL